MDFHEIEKLLDGKTPPDDGRLTTGRNGLIQTVAGSHGIPERKMPRNGCNRPRATPSRKEEDTQGGNILHPPAVIVNRRAKK